MPVTVWIVTIASVMVVAAAALGPIVRRGARYRDPQLHDGRWVLDWDNSDHSSGVTWRRVDQTPFDTVQEELDGGYHVHKAQVCTIAPGMAHVDECACYATRYGVYGMWHEKELQP